MFPGKQFVFIIGAPRSGTTWLQAMLAAHPSICSTVDELKLFDFFTVPLEENWRNLLSLQKETRRGRNGLAALWTDNEFYDFLKEFTGRVYTQVLATKPDATVLLDKTPGYSHHVEHIERLIPDAKFIHILRDGRDVAVSLMAAAQGWGRSWAPKEVEASAVTWKSFVIACQKARQYGERYCEIRYEKLLADGIPELRRVFEFMKVTVDDETLTAIYNEHTFENMKQSGTGANNFALPANFFRNGKAGDWRRSLGPEQRYIFHQAAGDILCALGYGDPDWWFERPHQRATVPLRVMLSSRSRMRMKAAEAIKRALGPKWTERIRRVRRGSAAKRSVEASVGP